MKRFLCVILSLIMVAALLVACGNSATVETPSVDEETPVVTDKQEETPTTTPEGKGIYWMLSNVTDNNGKPNDILKKWLKDNQGKYYVYFMQRDYSSCNYNRKDNGKTVEVAVTNYNASPNDPYIEPIPIRMNMYYNPPIVPED